LLLIFTGLGLINFLRGILFAILLETTMPDTRLILHVKGTEAETTELPKQIVRAAISQGQITHSQLIWSPSHNSWKQVRELPDLLPSQKLAPAPRPATGTLKQVIPESPSNPVARAAAAKGTPTPRVATASGPTPKIRSATAPGAAPKAQASAAPGKNLQVRVSAAGSAKPAASLAVEEHKEDFHLFKWVCIGLGAVIFIIIGLNVLFEDEPVVSGMGQTPYSGVREFAHLGAFVQPDVLVIHIPTSAKLTPDNIPDFLSALARSTPRNPITGNLFERVALTSGWTAQYSFSGYSWKELGQMTGQDDGDQRKEFIITQMNDAAGGSLLPSSTLSPESQESRRDTVWKTFVAHFSANP
jgi:hypothetical protein